MVCKAAERSAHCRSARRYACRTLAFLALATSFGCASVQYPQVIPSPGSVGGYGQCIECFHEEIGGIRKALLSMGGVADEKEAGIIAEVAVCYSLELSNQYKLVRPPSAHNILVNMGFRKQGLCYHWANDLILKLHSLKLKSFEFYKGVAYQKKLKEHNCVVVTPLGGSFCDGLVLDSWRNSGKVFAVPVKDDTYPWQPQHFYLPCREQK